MNHRVVHKRLEDFRLFQQQIMEYLSKVDPPASS